MIIYCLVTLSFICVLYCVVFYVLCVLHNVRCVYVLEKTQEIKKKTAKKTFENKMLCFTANVTLLNYNQTHVTFVVIC